MYNFLRYRLPYRYAILPKEPFMILEPNYKNSIEIGIKQIKEDLEEKNESAEEISIRIANELEEKLEKHFKEYMDKIDTRKLKPFDLEAAKEGKPVCTRDGRKARIICFDLKNNVCPIVAAVEENNNMEVQHHYDTKGLNCYKKSEIDLMMLPEKKEGWVNVAKEPLGDDEVVLGYIFNSYEDAVRSGKANERYVATVRIEWEG